MIWHEAEAAKEKRRFIDYYGVDLQLTLYSTNTGMTGFFPPSSKRWNAKEMAEKQLEMIAERFQQSCEMPWIQSISSEAGALRRGAGCRVKP